MAENIRKYRKERGMTQEELAEKLNLTLGTISKWERGSSEPELSYLMQLAQIFHVSVDALIGFSIRSNNADALVDKIDKLLEDYDFDDAKKECEAAILIYPNHFKVVYEVACAYNMIGTVMNEKEALRAAIKHFRHSLDLFAQNTDPRNSVTGIKNQIAFCYLAVNETQKGIDELKKNNVCGINDADIANNLITVLMQDEEGLEYALKAFAGHAAKLITVLFSIMSYYLNEKKYDKGIFAADWTLNYLRSFKIESDKNSFVEKYVASTLLVKAVCMDAKGDWEQAEKTMDEAFLSADDFDRDPSFNTRNIVFLENVESGSVYDSLGITAKTGLLRIMDEFHFKERVSERFCEHFKKKIEKEG